MTASVREMAARVLAFLRKRRLDEDLEQELAAHLELAIQDNLARGLSPEEARRAALVRLGGIESAKERHRESRGLPVLDALLQDVRYAVRTLRRDAGLTAFAILIVGLGVGASSTVFSVASALLLRPLPFTDAGRLVWIQNDDGPGLSGETIQVAHLQDLQEQSRSFSSVAGFRARYGSGDNKLSGAGEPERLTGVQVTEGFFSLLGVAPQLGRLFDPEECRWGAPKAVLLSHRLWQRRFAADPGIVGRSLTLNDAPATVIGVLPESFDFGSVFAPGTRVDLFSPWPLSPETSRQGNTLSMIGRLAAGVTPAAATAEIRGIVEGTRREAKRNKFDPTLIPLREHVSGRFRPAVLVLASAVAFVMLIVCANLSNLLLARATTRAKEMAIRAALGAGRLRLVRQLLTESLLLSGAGAVLGLLLAVFGTGLLASLNANVPLLAHVRVDAGVLGFTLLLALSAGLLFGLAPALRVEDANLQSALKTSGRGASERGGALRGALVAAEVGFACVLLVGAGLLIRSFLRVLDVDPGFRPASAAAMRVDPGPLHSSQQLRNAYFAETLARVGSVPGIEAAGLADALPLGSNRSWNVAPKGQVYPEGETPEAFVWIVSDGYLRAMGMSLRSGRDFSSSDDPDTPPVVLVNEMLARTLWPGENPIGRILRVDREREVVGVVGDVRHQALEQGSGLEVYLPIRQTKDYARVYLIVRGTHGATALAGAVREAMRPIAPSLPLNEFRLLQDIVDQSLSPRRLIVRLLAAFGGFALVLASLGTYGVISYSVTRRRQEIGIRIALGASAGDVQRQVLAETLRLVALGAATGLLGSWALSRVMKSLLFGVTPSDPVSFAAALALLLAASALAGYLPARRASRLDPVAALRAE